MRRDKKRNQAVLLPLLVALMVWLLLQAVFIVGYVPSDSMEPAIQKGSFIVGVRFLGEPTPGDVIIFWHEGRLLVKRVAAVGGQQIEHNGKHRTVPEGCCYVLGDNVERSADSRCWENPFVTKREVEAKVIFLRRRMRVSAISCGNKNA